MTKITTAVALPRERRLQTLQRELCMLPQQLPTALEGRCWCSCPAPHTRKLSLERSSSVPQVCSQDSIPGGRVVPTQRPSLPPLSHPRGRKDPLYLSEEGQGTEGELEGSDKKMTLTAVLVPL